ncbi:MAG: AcrR family transcriptional regulator [Halioglobus sp.]|jgi:AcrR family transcriptional regulator
MAYKTPPRPRKYPKQNRSQLLVEAIQESCLQILQKSDAKTLSTQHIADVAGVSIASVYQYFPNKEAILASVYDKALQQLADLTSQRFADFQSLSEKSLEQTLAAIISLEADQLLIMHRLSPDFFSEYSQSFDVHTKVDELTQSMKNPSWKDWFPEFLSMHKNRLCSTDLNTLSFFARNTMDGMLKAALTEDPTLLESDAFRAELLKLLVRYLVDEAYDSLQ